MWKLYKLKEGIFSTTNREIKKYITQEFKASPHIP